MNSPVQNFFLGGAIGGVLMAAADLAEKKPDAAVASLAIAGVYLGLFFAVRIFRR